MNSMEDIWNEELSADQVKSINPNEIGDGNLTEEQLIYRENIIDHYRYPHNKGTLHPCDIKHTEKNVLCGDTIELFVKFDSDLKVSGVTFEGYGCAISQASVSLLTDFIKGKTLSELEQISRQDIVDLLGIPIGPVRMRCALLSLRTLLKGIEQYKTVEATA